MRDREMISGVLDRTNGTFRVVVCDWVLDGDELAEACRITSDPPVAFLRPFSTAGRMLDEEFICG